MSILPWALITMLVGQSPADPPTVEPLRQDRMRFMKEAAAEFEVFLGTETETPLKLKSEPVLRYSNPVADVTDGATFLWLSGAQPIAAVSYSIRGPEDRIFREWTSLSASSLDCRKANVTIWTPATGGLLAQKVDDAPPPADSQAQRLTQMRQIARRFSGSRFYAKDDTPTELRLLPAPLYRYTDEKVGIQDGGLFAFVIGNDPELFLLLDAIREAKAETGHWQYSLARMSSSREIMRFDDKEIWSIPNIYREPALRKPTAAYGETQLGKFISKPKPSNE